MKPSAPHAELFDFHALWSLAREAGAWVRGDPLDRDEDDPHEPTPAQERERSRRHDAGLETWRFVAAAAADRGEARMLPLVRWMIDVAEDYPRERRSVVDGISEILSHVAKRAHERPETLDVLLDDPRWVLRGVLARSLDTEAPVARAALMRLAGDPWSYVRRAARERLERRGVVLPWWHGLTTEDPEREAGSEAARAAVAELRAVLDVEFPKHDESAPVREWLDVLPPTIGVELASALARSRWPGALADQPLRSMLALGASSDALRVVLRAWGGEHWFHAKPLGEALSTHQRLQLALAMIAEISAPAVGLRATYARRVSETLLGALPDVWPGGDADQEPILSLVLGGPVASASERTSTPMRTWAIGQALTPEHPSLARHDAAIRAAVARGLPGAWAALPYQLVKHYGKPPRDVARRAAREALASADPRAVRRAIDDLLGDLHEPSEDPPVAAVARALYDAPETRAAVLASRRTDPALLRRARRALARAELDVEAAAELLQRLAKRGELAWARMGRDLARPEPPPARPGVRPSEWVAFRALRDGVDLSALSADAHATVATTLPRGAGLDAADAPSVDAALARLQARREPALVEVLDVLTGKRDEAVDARIERVVRALLEGELEPALASRLARSARIWDFPRETLARLAARLANVAEED